MQSREHFEGTRRPLYYYNTKGDVVNMVRADFECKTQLI
jgi:hypothetical protein